MKGSPLLLGLLLLGCAQQSPSFPQSTPGQVIRIDFQGNAPVSPQQGIQSLRVDVPAPTQVVSGLQLQHLSSSSFTVKRHGKRYLGASYRITNQTGRTLHDLALVGVNLDDLDSNPANNGTQPTAGRTPFSRVQLFDGSDASAKAVDLIPGHLHQYSPPDDRAVFDVQGTAFTRDLHLTGFQPAAPSGLLLEVLDFGWVLYGDFEAGASRTVTFSTEIPLGATSHQDPFSFSLMAAFAELNLSRPVQFSDPITWQPPSRPGQVVVADFNADGHMDLGVALPLVNQMVVYLNQGTGQFSQGATFDTGFFPDGLAAGDVNRDGYPDLVSANQASMSVSVWLAPGTGNFLPRQDWDLGGIPTSILLSDVNGDAAPDVVTTGPDSGIRVLMNSGSGQFSSPVLTGVGEGTRQVVAGDLNQDGHPDLAAVGFPNRASVFLNNGQGGFSASSRSWTNTDPVALTLADFNQQDGLDVAVASLHGGSVGVLLNDSKGGLDPRTDHAVGVPHAAIATADFNGDHLPDIAVGDFPSGLQLLFNDGSGAFLQQQKVDFEGYPRHLASADFNRDGRADLVAVDPDGGTLTVLLQE